MTWDQFQTFFNDYGPIIGFVVAALVFAFIVRKAWPTITQFVTSVNTVATLPGKFAEIEKSLKTLKEGQVAISDDVTLVRSEVQHNGGGSLKDAVKVTQELVTTLKRDVGIVNRRIRQVEVNQQLAAALLTKQTGDVLVETVVIEEE